MRLTLLLAVLAVAGAAQAQTELEKGFAGALRGCEEWVLNPGSWSSGPDPFVAAVGLGNEMRLVAKVDDAALPPPELRRANHYWRINSTQGAGFILVVSDEIPMCHITGGGDTDLEPSIESVLASADFAARWEEITDRSKDDTVSTEFRS